LSQHAMGVLAFFMGHSVRYTTQGFLLMSAVGVFHPTG
jgi:hypothetical protein